MALACAARLSSAPEDLPGPEIDPAPAPAELPPPAPAEVPPSPPAPAPSPPTAVALVDLARSMRAVAAALAAGGLLSLSLPTVRAQPAVAPVSATDRHFMDEAVSGGMVEIVLGRIAEEKAAGEPVRQLGAHMVEDHNKANEELKALAAAKAVRLPTGLSSDEKAAASHLRKLKGANFDRQYLARMLADHQKTLTLFVQASASAADPDIKAFASKTLPTLRAHLETVRQASAGAAPMPHRGTAARE